jgi:hypothetical protein
MSNYYGKQPSSRLNKAQTLTWTGTGTLVSTNFANETFQIRITSQLAGWIAIDNLGTVPTTAGGNGSYFPATATPEYFTVTPGQLFSFSSTTTSSGQLISCTEMA